MKLSLFTTYIFLLALCLFVYNLPSAFSQGFTSITPLDPIPMNPTFGTQDKSQSKVFIHDGKHWAVIANPAATGGTGLYRLDGTSWTFIINVSGQQGRADCKIIGDVAHIFLFRNSSSLLKSLQYNATNQTFESWDSRPGEIGFAFGGQVQTATIDIDGAGKMWIAYLRRHNPAVNGDILVRWSIPPYSIWSEEILLGNGREDDVATMTALPGKIGVFWSDQTTQRFGFKTHLDEDPPDVWSANEVPASQSAINFGAGMADDHMNLAVSSTGILYAAVKNGYNNPAHPLISLLVRQPSGIWDNSYTVSNSGTTPIALLNEAQGKIKVVYSSATGEAQILYKESSTSNISFGSTPQTLIGDSNVYRDPTGIKSTYNPDVVVLASNQTGGVAAGVLGSDAPAPIIPPAPSLISPAHSAIDVVVNPILSWTTAAEATKYWLQVSTTSNFTTVEWEDDNISLTNFQGPNLANLTEYFWRVQARNSTGSSPWSEIRSFTTEVPPPSPPGNITLVTPSNSATNVPRNPTLTWQTATDADSYELQVALNSNGSNPVYNETGITGTSFQLSGLSYATSYYWRVRAINNVGMGAWSVSRIFTTENAPVAPTQAPILVSPANATNNLQLSLSLEWAAVNGADGYSLQVAKSTDFETEVLVSDQTTSSTSAQLSGLENEVTYYWRVQGLNEAGPGPWSQVWSFSTEDAPIQIPDVPELLSPAHQASGLTLNPVLEWEEDEDADFYGVQVSLTTDFTEPFKQETHHTQSSYSLSNLAFGTQYFWRVRAKNSAGDSEWSEVRSFTTLSEADALAAHFKMDEGGGTALTDHSPNANHAQTVGGPSWVGGKNGLALGLDGTTQYASAPDHPSLDITGAITLAGWIRPEKTATQYLITKTAISATDGYELTLASNGKIFFRFNEATAGNSYRITSLKAYPTDGTTWMHVAVTFDGSILRLYVDGVEDANKFLPLPAMIATNGLALTIGANTNGYMKLQGAIDDLRIYNIALGAPAIQDMATVAPSLPPAPPQLAAPENNSTGVSTAPDLSWNPSEGPVFYQLQVSTDAGFSTTAFDQNGITTTSATANGLTNGTPYFWRVRASNGSQNSEWSEVRSFTTLSEADALAAHFKMDEGGGTALTDHSPNANHAQTVGGPSWVGGKNGLALGLDGTTQYASAPDHPSLDITGAITLAGWIRPEKTATQYLITKTAISATDGYELTLASNGKIFFRFNEATAGNSYRITSLKAYPTDGTTWMHVAVTFDGSILRLYVDGVEDANKFLPLPAMIATNGLALTIGANTNGYMKLQGAIDDLRIYNIALGAPAIQDMATVAPSLPPAPPQLAAPENNSTGVSTAPDLSWNPSEGPVFYQLQVSTDAGFSTTAFDQNGITTTSATANGLTNGTPYFWRVRASNGSQNSEWSEVRSFTTLSEADALAAHFKMDEGGGTALTDHSPNANHAQTVGGPSWVGGKNGLALGLDGTTQYASAPDHPSLDITGAITLAGWIRPEKTATQYLITKTAISATDGYELTLASNGKIFFRFNEATAGNSYRITSLKAYPTDGTTWMHVAVTFDGSILRLYVDGVEDANKFLPLPAMIATNGLALTIGANTNGYMKLQGAIDDLRIYNIALGAPAIQDMATVAPSLPPAPPQLAAPENNSTGVSTAPDLSWNPSEGPVFYQLQVSTDAGFSTTAFDQNGITTTSATANGLTNGTPYFWRVRASNGSQNSEWSEVRSFTTLSEADALAAHFKMDEGGGTALTDHSPNANHAQTVGGPSWVGGKNGLALGLDGTTQYASAPDHPSLDITGAITLAGWIRPEKTATQYLITKTAISATDGYELTLASNGKIFFRFNEATAGNSYRITSLKAYPTDGTTWMHVAVTFDGSILRLYVDGVEDANKFLPLPAMIATNGLALTIGANTNGYMKLQGAIDDLRIYNIALGAPAIQDMVQPPSTGNPNARLSSPSDVQANSTGEQAENEVSDPYTLNKNLEIKLYPNPVENEIHLEFVGERPEMVHVLIYDQLGRTYWEKEAALETGNLIINQLEKTLKPGVYYLRVQSTGISKNFKILKK